MVVTEGEGLYSLCHWLDVVFHLFGRCNTRQEQHMIVGHSRQGWVFHFFLFIALDFLWLQFLAVEYALWGIIVNAGEVELLERVEVHRLGQHSELHRFQVLRTFGDDHDVGTVLSAQRFAEPSCRHHLVIDDETVIIYQQDVDAWLDIAVLEGIVQQYHIHVLGFPVVLQMVNTSYSFGIYCNIDVLEFLVHLEGFIANLCHLGIFIG